MPCFVEPSPREFWVRGALAALGHPQHGGVQGRCSWVSCPDRTREDNRLASQHSAPALLIAPYTYDEVEPATALRSDMQGGGVGQPHYCGTQRFARPAPRLA